MLYLPATAGLAGIISSLIINGKEGVKNLFKYFRFKAPEVSRNEAFKIWLQAIVLVLILRLINALYVNIINNGVAASFTEINSPYSITVFIFILFTSMLFDGGGLMEEFGWRGFALPILQNKFTPLKSAIILGTLWSIWHIPVKMNVWPILEFFSFYFSFTVSCILLTIIMVYFFNKLGGSVMITIAIHGLCNDSAGLGVIFSPENPKTNSLVYSGMWIIILAAAVLFILYKEGVMLGLKTDKSIK